MCGYLLCAPCWGGTWPTTQACALAGNETCDCLVRRPALNPLSHNSEGHNLFSMKNVSVHIVTMLQHLKSVLKIKTSR